MTTSYALYDSRYTTNPDRAICYSFCDTLKEARQEKKEDFTDAVIVKVGIVDGYICKSEIVK